MAIPRKSIVANWFLRVVCRTLTLYPIRIFPRYQSFCAHSRRSLYRRKFPYKLSTHLQLLKPLRPPHKLRLLKTLLRQPLYKLQLPQPLLRRMLRLRNLYKLQPLELLQPLYKLQLPYEILQYQVHSPSNRCTNSNTTLPSIDTNPLVYQVILVRWASRTSTTSNMVIILTIIIILTMILATILTMIPTMILTMIPATGILADELMNIDRTQEWIVKWNRLVQQICTQQPSFAFFT